MKFILLLALAIFSNNIYSQQNQTMTNKEIVVNFLNGFNDPTQIQHSMNLLADDYKFKNPMLELNSKAEFIGLAKEIGKVLTGVELIHAIESENWVATYYIFKSSISGLERNTATEWFRIENGQIKESRLIYDASEWRKVYAQMEE